MNNVNLVVMNAIVAAAASVEDKAALRHLRQAFVRLASVTTKEVFTISLSKHITHNGVKYPLSFGDVTIIPSEFDALVYQGKLSAIKEYKNRTGKGLIDSKHDIERYVEGANVPMYRYT